MDKENMKKIIIGLLVIITTLIGNIGAFAANNEIASITPGKYIFVSFSMPDESLRAYFKQAQEHEFVLVLKGFTGREGENKILKTRSKLQELRINAEINPTLFEELNIGQVPVIAIIDDLGNIRKVAGHIPLQSAIDIMKEGN